MHRCFCVLVPTNTLVLVRSFFVQTVFPCSCACWQTLLLSTLIINSCQTMKVILLPCVCLILPPSCNGNKCWIFEVVDNIWMVFSFFYSLFSVSYLFMLLLILERFFFVLCFVSFHYFLHLRTESGWFRKLRLGDHFS